LPVLLALADALGFALFLGLADVLAVADGADPLAEFVAVNPAACEGLDGEPPLRTTITATRAIASTIAPPSAPLIMRGLRIEVRGRAWLDRALPALDPPGPGPSACGPAARGPSALGPSALRSAA
jgi:hypothetical protein